MMKSPNTLMIQGTTSDAGKSLLVAALCRILNNHKLKVAPFKPQNMALNSAVTAEGGEIGRAQAMQAMAARVTAHVDMNPVLLKPQSDTGAQVIVLGQPVGMLEAWGFNDKKPMLLPEVINAHARLRDKYHAVMVEGAGSPAEINLRRGDIANMGFAEAVDCPVIIVTDIDRGGAYAHLLGTFECLSHTEKARIKGFVINKFRGDERLLKSANTWLLEKTGVPILAVIPYIPDLYVEAEDAIDFAQPAVSATQTHEPLQHESLQHEPLQVAVIAYPRLSNHTDFDVLRLHPHINLQFVRFPHELKKTDLIILPGSKNTQADLAWLRKNNWPKTLQKHLRYDGKILGICGGYQMLGSSIEDPQGVEGSAGSFCEGLNFLEMHTKLTPEKMLRNVAGVHIESGAAITGYEIHVGESDGESCNLPLFNISPVQQKSSVITDYFTDGATSSDNLVKGTYLHGVLDNPEFLEHLLAWAGLQKAALFDIQAYREEQLDYLAQEVEKAWPAEDIMKLLAVQG